MQFDQLKRRDFITLLGGAAAWPLPARAQQAERVRRIGVLMNMASDDPESQARLSALVKGLQELGWTVGRNVRIDYRWGEGDAERYRRQAAEMFALEPDVIVSWGAEIASGSQKASRAVPIVFAQSIDPVGSGMVASLARPGGNATGFTQFEYSLSGKWLELLKQVAPGITRTAVLRDAGSSGGIGQWAIIQAGASSSGVEAFPINLRDAAQIEHAVADFARPGNGGLIVTMSVLGVRNRQLIIALAARHKLPAIYPERFYVADGGLLSYGPNVVDQYRRAAGYVDRILRGEKPANLPVQAPTKYELAVNLKTAKALGITLPPGVLALADEVIE
jgi:putative tryptophan/tyrosine transport system substrate-binding protein